MRPQTYSKESEIGVKAIPDEAIPACLNVDKNHQVRFWQHRRTLPRVNPHHPLRTAPSHQSEPLTKLESGARSPARAVAPRLARREEQMSSENPAVSDFSAIVVPASTRYSRHAGEFISWGNRSPSRAPNPFSPWPAAQSSRLSQSRIHPARFPRYPTTCKPVARRLP